MRIIRFLDPSDHECWGRDTGDGSAELLSGSPMDIRHTSKLTGKSSRVKKLLAPVVPTNIFCVGLNYREHAKEGGQPIPEAPVLFMKPTTAVTNPGDPILLPACSKHGPETDYECELAVVIGKPGRNIPLASALDHVLGYTAANDVSARKWQRNNGTQWVRGKSFDGFCPLGPALVTAGKGPDDIADPQTLGIKTILNGKTMQSHTTADMIFPVAQIISFISQDTTLLTGTLILTGTPQGVGVARNPPVFMMPGDKVAIEIDRIGKLENPVIAG